MSPKGSWSTGLRGRGKEEAICIKNAAGGCLFKYSGVSIGPVESHIHIISVIPGADSQVQKTNLWLPKGKRMGEG